MANKVRKQMVEGKHSFANRSTLETYGDRINGTGDHALIHPNFRTLGVSKEGWHRFMADLASIKGYPYMPNGGVEDPKAIPFIDSSLSKHFMHNHGVNAEVGRTHATLYHNLPKCHRNGDIIEGYSGGKPILVLQDFGVAQVTINPFDKAILSTPALMDKLLSYSQFEFAVFDEQGKDIGTRKPNHRDVKILSDDKGHVWAANLLTEGRILSRDSLRRIDEAYPIDQQPQRRQHYEKVQQVTHERQQKSVEAKQKQVNFSGMLFDSVLNNIDEMMKDYKGPQNLSLWSDKLPAYLAKKLGTKHPVQIKHRLEEFFSPIIPDANKPTLVNCLAYAAMQPNTKLAKTLHGSNMVHDVAGNKVHDQGSLFELYQRQGDCLIAFSKTNQAGEVSTVFQHISTADGGSKLYFKDQGLNGHFLNLGSSVTDKDVAVELLVEGFATGLELRSLIACDQKFSVLVCGDAGNLIKVAKQRALDTNRPLVIVADNDLKTQSTYLESLRKVGAHLDANNQEILMHPSDGNPGVISAIKAFNQAKDIRLSNNHSKGKVGGYVPYMPEFLRKEEDGALNVDMSDIGIRALDKAREVFEEERLKKAGESKNQIHNLNTPGEQEWADKRLAHLYTQSYQAASSYVVEKLNTVLKNMDLDQDLQFKPVTVELQKGVSLSQTLSSQLLRENRKNLERPNKIKHESTWGIEIDERDRQIAKMNFHGLSGESRYGNSGYVNLHNIDMDASLSAMIRLYANSLKSDSPDRALADVLMTSMRDAYATAAVDHPSFRKGLVEHASKNPLYQLAGIYEIGKILQTSYDQGKKEIVGMPLTENTASDFIYSAARGVFSKSTKTGIQELCPPREKIASQPNYRALATGTVLGMISCDFGNLITQDEKLAAFMQPLADKIKKAEPHDSFIHHISQAAVDHAGKTAGYTHDLKEFLHKMLEQGRGSNRLDEHLIEKVEMPTESTLYTNLLRNLSDLDKGPSYSQRWSSLVGDVEHKQATHTLVDAVSGTIRRSLDSHIDSYHLNRQTENAKSHESTRHEPSEPTRSNLDKDSQTKPSKPSPSRSNDDYGPGY